MSWASASVIDRITADLPPRGGANASDDVDFTGLKPSFTAAARGILAKSMTPVASTDPMKCEREGGLKNRRLL